MGEKKQIQIAVKDKIACLVDKEQFLVCGNNDYEVVFDFDSDWEGISAKTAVFVYGDTPIHQPFTGDICKGVEIKNATLCAIGVFAGNIKTTTGATIECRQSIRDLGGVPKPPTKEVYDEIMALLDKAIEAHTELPVGGKTGQILKKRSDEDYDTYWADEEKEDLSVFVKNEDFEIATNEVDKKISDLDFRVSTLENLTLQYISDKSVSYKKDVPINSGDHATLRSIGGMTYIDETKNTFVDAKVTELKAHGANLIPYPYVETTKTTNGITFTDNGDGSITINGTSTNESYFRLETYRQSELSAGTYSVTLVGEGTEFSVEGFNGNTWIKTLIHGNGTIVVDWDGYTEIRIILYIYTGRTVDSTVYPMFNKGSTALPYEPFKEAETIFQIPAEIQALPNYGKMFTEVDLVNKKFVDKYFECDYAYSATEYCGEEGGNDEFPVFTDISITFEPSPVAPPIDVLGLVKSEKPYDSIEFNGINFTLTKRIEGYTSVGGGKYTKEEFDSFGMGSFDDFVNELFGTITVIIPHYRTTEHNINLDNIIKVTAGGAIEFVNEHKFAVPSEIVYVARKE